MDPAGPLFDYSPGGGLLSQLPRNTKIPQSDLDQISLSKSDAAFVQIIHTSSNKGGPEVSNDHIIKLGHTGSIGHVDFFPSKSTELPGSLQLESDKNQCIKFLLRLISFTRAGRAVKDILGAICDHNIAKKYWIKSINGKCFKGVSCRGAKSNKNHCAFHNRRNTDMMGFYAAKPVRPTDYFVPVVVSGREIILKNGQCR